MKKVLALLLALIATINGNSNVIITENNISEYIESDCETVANFIIENINLFVEEYNEQLEEDLTQFEASSCEKMIPVYVVTIEEEGIYIDFDGDNGYMIILDDYEVIAFETSGDIDYIKELEYTYYSIYDGFLYIDNDNYVPYDFQEITENEWEEFYQIEMQGSYAGQESGTDGEIVDTDAYVADRYGNGYTVYDENKLIGYKYVTQGALSIYFKNGTDSEGNCSLASIYSLMNYLQRSGKYPDLPSSSSYVKYYATSDSFYSKYANDDTYVIKSPVVWPELYLKVRNYAVKNYGYEVDGTNPFNIETIIKEVGKEYGYTLSTNHILVWTYEAQVVDEIDAGYPIIWNMANSSTYNSHTAVVTGYKTYRKTTTILGIKFYSYVQLMQLNDNWNASARYFDFTNYNLFGSFVKVR